MNSNIKKSYYAVIPVTVRYDNNVVPSAKLLYGEITALCNEKGYCWATNDYFSKLYSVSKRTISTWVKSLCDAGYISAEFVLDNSNQKVKMRCLKVEANFSAHLMKISIPSALSLALNVAKSGKTACFYSMEMESSEIYERLLSSMAKIPMNTLIDRRFQDKKRRVLIKK